MEEAGSCQYEIMVTLGLKLVLVTALGGSIYMPCYKAY